jgi:hypothetical protein
MKETHINIEREKEPSNDMMIIWLIIVLFVVGLIVWFSLPRQKNYVPDDTNQPTRVEPVLEPKQDIVIPDKIDVDVDLNNN